MRKLIHQFIQLMVVISLVRPSPLAAQTREISSWYLHMTPMGNEVWRIGALFGAILVGIGAGKLLKYLLAASSERLEAKHHRYSAVALSSLSRVATLVMALIGLRVGVRFLHMVPQVETMINSVISILATHHRRLGSLRPRGCAGCHDVDVG